MTQTKKFKQVFSFLLALTLIVSLFQVNGAKTTVNAATKYYTIEAYKDVKIGNYTYHFNEDKNILQRKKSGASKYTTIVKNVYNRCIATSKKIYYITDSGNYSVLYQCNMNGKGKKTITTLPNTQRVVYVSDTYAMYMTWSDAGNYIAKKHSYQ